ncbi:MAG: 2OG-Fe dioxygenase family protein [Methylocella sp.]
MNLAPHGYRIVDIPAASDALLASFNDLPLDEFCGGRQRFHRFSQYRLRFRDGHWHPERLPHRPLLQSHVYNSKSGNVTRHIAPVQADAANWVDAALQSGGLDTARDWHLDINQYRVITTPSIKGITVPEGVHQDGHHYVMIFVFRRHAITGATLSLLPVGGGPPFLQTIIEAGQAIIIDDTRMLHDASPIEPIGDYGYRDYFGTALNPWEERRYGEEFEAKVLAAAASQCR